MIIFKDVSVSFSGQRVLRGVSLHVKSGSITTIVGPSGSGKSTILRVAMGFRTVDSGSVAIDGEDVTSISEKRWTRVRRKMGMVFQHSALFDSLSVVENVGFYPYYVDRLPWRKVREQAMELLSELGLAESANKMPEELSGGMQRRVALARALVYHPKILLYDEPTTGLDPQNSDLVSNMIREANEKFGVTSVVVTHDLQCIHALSDEVVLITGGEGFSIGKPHQLFVATDPRVVDFTQVWRKQMLDYASEMRGETGGAVLPS
ncbi:ATP-binding cassette domain-containing protein [bacterium]|nr:ATP-binding cassette domain-containing protein [bacterium]